MAKINAEEVICKNLINIAQNCGRNELPHNFLIANYELLFCETCGDCEKCQCSRLSLYSMIFSIRRFILWQKQSLYPIGTATAVTVTEFICSRDLRDRGRGKSRSAKWSEKRGLSETWTAAWRVNDLTFSGAYLRWVEENCICNICLILCNFFRLLERVKSGEIYSIKSVESI